jgi:hypothetical protein
VLGTAAADFEARWWGCVAISAWSARQSDSAENRPPHSVRGRQFTPSDFVRVADVLTEVLPDGGWHSEEGLPPATSARRDLAGGDFTLL